MISYNGEVKLTDFGVSKAAIKLHHTLSGALKGKLLYMSPEQARGEETVDNRSDLYSLGVVLYELVTGWKVFMDNSEMGVLKKVQGGEVTPPREMNPDLDPELEKVILKALQEDRNQRYQSAAEMLADLEALVKTKFSFIPGAVHLSHFICDLFIDDIQREGVKIELKPLPEKIVRREKPVRVEKAKPPDKIVEISLEAPTEAARPRPQTVPVPADILSAFTEAKPKRRLASPFLIVLFIVVVLAAAVYFIFLRPLFAPPAGPGRSQPLPQAAATSSLAPISTSVIPLRPSSPTTSLSVQRPSPSTVPPAGAARAPETRNRGAATRGGTGENQGQPQAQPNPPLSTIPFPNLTEPGVPIAEIVKTGEPAIKNEAPPLAAVKEGDLLPLSQVDTPPQPLSTPEPILPSATLSLIQESQTLVVNLLIDENGNVASASLIRRSAVAALNTGLLKTVRNWKYQPAVKNGMRVKVWKSVSIAIKK